MSTVYTIGTDFDKEDCQIKKDNRTYLLENILFPCNGYIRKIVLSFNTVAEPIKLQVLKRNNKGKLKLVTSQKLKPTKTGLNVFSVANDRLKAIRINKRYFLAIRIPKNGSLINFYKDFNNKIQFKNGKWSSANDERQRKGIGVKIRIRFVDKKMAFRKNNGNEGNYILDVKNNTVEIGDLKKTDFNLSFKSIFEDENCFFNIYYDSNLIDSVSTSSSDGLLDKLIVDMKPEAHFDRAIIYPKDNPGIKENEGLEIELIINSRPSNNVVRFNIEHQGVEFFKQLPYNEISIPSEDVALGVDYRTETEGYKGGVNGELVYKMPHEAVNSIAVYKQNRSIIVDDDDKYDAIPQFKIAHIERIKITDSQGNWVWGNQNINLNNNRYRIIIPQDFIDNAAYPISIDPLIGYTNLGASTLSINDLMIGNVGTPGSEGIVTTFYSGLNADWDNGEPVKMALYDVPGNEIHDPVSDEKTQGHNVSQFVEFPMESKEGTFIEAVQHAFLVFGGGNLSIHRDIGGVVTNSYYQSLPYGPFPTIPTMTPSVNLYSTYAAYVQQIPLNWGLPTPAIQKDEEKKYMMLQGGLSPNINGLAIREIAINVNKDNSHVTMAVYEGGTLNDPTTAIKKTEIVYYPVNSGWNIIEVPNIPWSANTPTWIGLVTENGTKHRFTDQPTDRGDFDINGRYDIDTPGDWDETQPLPTNPPTGAFVDNRWIHTYIIYTTDFRITGTINALLPEMQIDAQGFKGVTGTISTTLDEMLIIANAIKEYRGTITATLPEMNINASGTPEKQGAINVSLAEMTIIATGQKILYGIINALLPELEIDSEGMKYIPGKINALLPEVSILANGKKEIQGNLITVLPEMIINASGTPEKQGTINVSLPEMIGAFTGVNYSAHTGTISALLEEMSINAIGFVYEKYLGTITATLPEISIDASGTPEKQGLINALLPEMTIVSTGTPIKHGVINTTLPEIIINASGTPEKQGTINVSLPEIEIDATGQKYIRGHLNALLPEMIIDARAGRQTNCSMNVQLPEMLFEQFAGILFQNPISYSLIEYAIWKAVKCAYDGEVIWEDQDGPSPKDPFVSLRMTGLDTFAPTDPDHHLISEYEEEGKQYREYIGDRTYKITISSRGLTNVGTHPIEVLENIRSYLNNEESCEFIQLANSVYIEAPSIINLGEIDGIRNVQRAQMDVTFNTFSLYRREVYNIEQVNLTLNADTGNDIKNIDIEIKE